MEPQHPVLHDNDARRLLLDDQQTIRAIQMLIHEDELQWAHEIKAAIKAASHLQDITDYECAQFAIISMRHQDLDDVLERVYRLQCFKEHYKVCQDNNLSYAEEGLATIQGLMDFMPGFILSLDYMPTKGHYVFVTDKSKFTPAALQYEKDWKHLIAGTYFLFEIMCSNLMVTREGFAWMNECMGMGFHNYNPSVEERWMSDIVFFYPFIHKESIWLNSPTVANVLMSCLKPFLRDDNYKNVHMGCQLPGYEGESIEQLFQQPTPEIARFNLEKRIHTYLLERQHNVQHYQLPNLPLA